MTTSYKEGTEFGPEACISASSQVELFDELLGEELPCGFKLFTSENWNNEVSSLKEALESIEEFSSKWVNSEQFPILLGVEHGMVLPIIRSLKKHTKTTKYIINIYIIMLKKYLKDMCYMQSN